MLPWNKNESQWDIINHFTKISFLFFFCTTVQVRTLISKAAAKGINADYTPWWNIV